MFAIMCLSIDMYWYHTKESKLDFLEIYVQLGN